MSPQSSDCLSQVQGSQEEPLLHDLFHGLWPSYCCWADSWPSFLYCLYPTPFDFFTEHIIDMFWEVNGPLYLGLLVAALGFGLSLGVLGIKDLTGEFQLKLVARML